MGRFKKRTGVAMLTLAMVVLPAMAVQAATMGTFEEVSLSNIFKFQNLCR